MNWIIFTFFGAFFQNLRSSLQKKLNKDLSFDVDAKIGSYQQSYIYHVEIIDNYIWFAVTNNDDFNFVKQISFSGEELNSYEVGISPGDFAKWEASE